MTSRRLLCLALALACSHTAAAVDASAPEKLERITVSASTSRSPDSEAALPNTVTVITAEELRQQLTFTNDLSVVLANLVPAFAPGRQKLTSFGESLRGRQPLYLIDGVPQSTPLRDGSRDAHTMVVRRCVIGSVRRFRRIIPTPGEPAADAARSTTRSTTRCLVLSGRPTVSSRVSRFLESLVPVNRQTKIILFLIGPDVDRQVESSCVTRSSGEWARNRRGTGGLNDHDPSDVRAHRWAVIRWNLKIAIDNVRSGRWALRAWSRPQRDRSPRHRPALVGHGSFDGNPPRLAAPTSGDKDHCSGTQHGRFHRKRSSELSA